jgi:hypothetical protein
MNLSKGSTPLARAAAVIVTAAAGFAVWGLSPRLVGTPLPWDATCPFYSTTLLSIGFLVSRLASTQWLGFFGVWAGQVIALVVLPLDRTNNMLGPAVWWVLGIAATGVGSLILVVGWFLGNALYRKLIERA